MHTRMRRRVESLIQVILHLFTCGSSYSDTKKCFLVPLLCLILQLNVFDYKI